MADWSEKPIELVEIGDRVKTFDENGNVLDSRVKRLYKKSYKRSFILSFEDGDFDVTGRHPFKRWNNEGFLAVSSLEPGNLFSEYDREDGWHGTPVYSNVPVAADKSDDYHNLEISVYFRYFVKTPGIRRWKAVSNRKLYHPYDLLMIC